MTKKFAHFRKDESLDRLAERINVAQFVSFAPGHRLRQEFCRIRGHSPNFRFRDARDAIGKLLQASSEGSVNVRSFKPDDLQSHEFVYGIQSLDKAHEIASRIAGSGFYVIVNETIDVKDGGVSGVIWNDTIEFAPGDTPRCVEKPGVASLPATWGIKLLHTVYGFKPEIRTARSNRLEFSIHPKPRGWRQTHTLGWELQSLKNAAISPALNWPNRFSRFLGDKTYGLLMAYVTGLPIPKTTVISRNVAPFSFGKRTGQHDVWLRTCPSEQVPGKFTTSHGWNDPFLLLSQEDPGGTQIPSVLAQSAVASKHSGALIVGADGDVVIEGKSGEGEILMRGNALPEELPDVVTRDVRELYEKAAREFGPVRFEWVHDGERAWIVQLHRGATSSEGSVLVPGDALVWHQFEVSAGLESLRAMLTGFNSSYDGIELIGQIGVTSHIADVVRKAGIPTRVVPFATRSSQQEQERQHVYVTTGHS